MSHTVSTILNILTRQKTKNVALMYSDYRARYNHRRVPPQEIRRDSKGRPSIVYVDRLQAIEFLKSNHNFLNRKELTNELQEAAKEHGSE